MAAVDCDPLVADALDLLRDTGLEGFSLDALAARRDGAVPRGDGAREQVLVRVWQHLRLRFLDDLMAATLPGMADAEFIDLYWQLAEAEPLTAALRQGLRGVIGGPLSPHSLASERLAMQAAVARASTQIGICLALEPEQARDAVLSLAALVLGAQAMDIDPPGTGAAGVHGSAETLAVMAAGDLFRRNAGRVLAGVRAEAVD